MPASRYVRALRAEPDARRKLAIALRAVLDDLLGHAYARLRDQLREARQDHRGSLRALEEIQRVHGEQRARADAAEAEVARLRQELADRRQAYADAVAVAALPDAT